MRQRQQTFKKLLIHVIKVLKFRNMPFDNRFFAENFCVEDDRKLVSCQNLDLSLS